uniref:2-oxoglutarate and iron-dependent oxygenase JMJD4 n=1 Tax=Crassostrea virginica TaxID=6565 RepID=A0A8B8DER1_CRAVI|nr:jmjC domain-containing protein 4-like isoform X1 [Crassostrea virginica]
MAASMNVYTLEKSVLNVDCIDKKKALRSFSHVKIDRVSHFIPPDSYSEFFENCLLRNQPCILSSLNTAAWKSRKDWTCPNGKPNFEFLRETFGHAVVPVANCKREKYSSQPKENKSFSDFLDYWQNYIESDYSENLDSFYLKDWHFSRDFPNYKAYETPCVFTSDWLNEFWDSKADNDDYRFVYMGPKGSWTPFHADVFRSFSWSANICGRKKWIFYPPGEEENLCNKYGHLVYNIDSAELSDAKLYPNYSKVKSRLEVIQEAGEIIYVPSGWHHQVHNLEDTISINHNWLNGCNVDICWQYIKNNLLQVQHEIADCREMEGWDDQCQLILNATVGIDYDEFLRFMEVISENRINQLQNHLLLVTDQFDGEPKEQNTDKNPPLDKYFVDKIEVLKTGVSSAADSKCLTPSGGCKMTEGQINHCVFDLQSVKDILHDMILTQEFCHLNNCKNRANDLIKTIDTLFNSIAKKIVCTNPSS